MNNNELYNRQIEELYNMPHNQLRKIFAIKECIKRLETLQCRHAPTFDNDPVICNILKQMRMEQDIIMAELRNREDAMALLEAYSQEE